VNVQSCVGYRVCFGMRGVVLCKSRDVEIVQDAGSVFITGRKENGGVGRKKREWSISKKHFRPGGMALSEWTRSVRAVRATPVADYSAPGVNTTRRVEYRPPIAVSPFLLALLVTYFKRRLWRCGQLLPYVGMGSLGIRLHRDCNG